MCTSLRKFRKYFIEIVYNMFHILMSMYVAFLFVLLTPGVLLRLPARSSLLTSAVVHGIVFAIVYHFTHNIAWYAFYNGPHRRF